ncbi:MAG: sulfurtransferase TusA family protein [Deltaproteobacteria bacterium]
MTATIQVDREKDCRGVGCPMNMVYAKVELSKLKSGQILSLLLDDGPPINNVPGSVQKEGHEILEKKQLADGAWQLLIRKA